MHQLSGNKTGSKPLRYLAALLLSRTLAGSNAANLKFQLVAIDGASSAAMFVANYAALAWPV
jgi:hypothetical protein